jgi:enoyl-CoA hydratase
MTCDATRAATFGRVSPVVQTMTSNGVATIAIDRAPVNALTPDHWSELRQQIDRTSADESVRVLVITGGPGRFCAGADISTLVEPSDEPALMLRLVAEAAAGVRSHRAPVIASIAGPAHGGGLELALACDIRIASAAATFAASGVNMGLVASVRSLDQTIGSTHARTMLLTGARVDSATADRWGLVSHFDEDPMRRSTELAQSIAEKAPLAIEATKRALNAVDDLNPHDHDELMTELFSNLAQSADHSEAINAFLEKRRPTFTRS